MILSLYFLSLRYYQAYRTITSQWDPLETSHSLAMWTVSGCPRSWANTTPTSRWSVEPTLHSVFPKGSPTWVHGITWLYPVYLKHSLCPPKKYVIDLNKKRNTLLIWIKIVMMSTITKLAKQLDHRMSGYYDFLRTVGVNV